MNNGHASESQQSIVTACSHYRHQQKDKGLKGEEYEYLNTSNNGGAGGSGNQDSECMLPLQLGQAEQGYTYMDALMSP